MAAHSKRLIRVAAPVAAAVAALAAALVAALTVAPAAVEAQAGRRIISLVPALTEMLYAIGAGPQVVAVSSFDDFPPEVKALPRVGALLDPDVERILTLRPDLVITYGSQGSLEAQLGRAGIRTFSYRHGGIEALLRTVRDLGAATGRAEEANRAATALEAQLEAIRARVRGRVRPRVLLVFGRHPQSLQQIQVSGGVGFLHELLEAAGGINIFADVPRESVQPSHETLLTRAPDVILEIHATNAVEGADATRERGVWSALASVPAVRSGRVHFLNGEYLVIPGPRIVRAAEAFARVLHPEAFR